VKLYVCWGTFPVPWPRKSASWRPGAHPCKRAYDALKEAGHSVEVVRVYGFGGWPDVTSGRKKIKRLTGESWVPVLVLDDGEVVQESKNIVDWARKNPALTEAASAPATQGEPGYIPALRWHALTPLFDLVVRTTMREATVKRRLLDQADISPGERVLDLGCGTGTLAIQLTERCPQALVTGLDADPEVLARARTKAEGASGRIDFVEGLATKLPFPDGHFDKVLSSLFFHHLPTDQKQGTLAEIVRVLKPGGELHVVDFGRPGDPLMAGLFLIVRTIDGFAVTEANARDELPAIFGAAGLSDVRRHRRLRTALGPLDFLGAVRS
jgi:SAM-dependent methyltransferase